MKTTGALFLLLIQTLQCLASDDSPFQLTNKATGFCLVRTNNICKEIRWTTGDRLLVPQRKKCLGVQGNSVGSEVSLYDCDENSDLQRWECRNETVLALKGQELYIELTAENRGVLSRTVGPNSQLTIPGTSSGACTRTYRELYAIGGNAAGVVCMFPFLYKNQWNSDCSTLDSGNRPWCAVETKYENAHRWGFCPGTSRADWTVHPTTGINYQFNTQSALTWPQAEASCKQQGASLLSITDPHQQAYVAALLGTGGTKLWTGLILVPDHGWKWSNMRPYRYTKWDSGHPLPDPGHNCAMVEPAVQYSWQSFPCSKKLGYICYIPSAEQLPTPAVETTFCSSPWIPYNGHCFYLNRTQKTWTDAQRECRSGGGDLASINNVEDQSFVISQLGYVSTDELWIGLNDRQYERLFDWIDHSTVSFTSWEFGNPDLSTDLKDCVLIGGEKGNWADHVCEEKHGYICMKPSSTKATGDEVEQDEGCKTGWRRHGSYCYFIGTQTKTFDKAVDDCKSSDSYLADVSNAVDNAFLVSLVGMRPEKHFWLGLSNTKNIDEFVWTNTESVRFTHWNAEMPGHGSGCVAMRTGIFAGLWDLLPCTNKEKYICKHLAEGVVVTPIPPSLTTPAKCHPDWTQLDTRNMCFKLFRGFSTPRTWYEARDYCKAIGGDLVSIHSDAELRLIKGFGRVWIGLSAPDPGIGYVWSDGSPLQFQHWESGEPNNKNNIESCVVQQTHRYYRRGSWGDEHCEKDFEFVCQLQIGVTPGPSPDPIAPAYNTTSEGWLEWNGNQYLIAMGLSSMEEARRYCKRKHSDLATINSEAESVFLWKQVHKNLGNYWIGLNVDLDKTSGWMDGSPVVFQRWDDGQPRFLNNDENCAVMNNFLGFWHASSCGHENQYICKRSGPPSPDATFPPTVIPTGGCPQNWKKFNTKCFISINKEKKTWDGARAQCKAMKGNLASIQSRHEHVFLITTMAEATTTDLWIGFHNINGFKFYWTDGRPRPYQNWGISRRPTSYKKKQRECVMMTSDPKEGLGEWLKTSCNDTNGFVCLRSIDPTFPDSPEPTPTNYVKILNDSVKVIPQKMTWYEAKQHCERDGAKLASLRNAWSQVYVELVSLNLNAPVWIGLNSKETDGYFRYIEGWHVLLTNWARGEPRSDQPCVYVDMSGKWKTSTCDKDMASVCMKTTDVPPTESTEFPGFCPDNPEKNRMSREMSIWLPFKGNCYLFLQDTRTWPEASVSCAAHGGALLSIEDPSEQTFVHSNLKIYESSRSSYWIGLYKTNKGQWLWLDKSAMDYTNWNVGEPYDSRYGLIRSSDGKWKSESSSYSRPYICKAPKVLQQAPTTTAGPTATPQTNNNNIMPVVIVICLAVVVIIIILVIYKKSGRRFPIPKKSSTFHNPLFSNSVLSQPDMAYSNKVEEDREPVISL
uniref:macrophage mannose receptor 1-like n=1 Tax=Semicossyphus pulcher TaxID=241346 RepID=UPI0037E78EBA